MNDYPIVPGRGLVTENSTSQRLIHIKELGFDAKSIAESSLRPDQVCNNIESFIGSVEIPVGLVGPLLFQNEGKDELIYTAAGTIEGALLASMNRGAKVISLSGGFSAEVIHQKMIRCPMFIFNDIHEGVNFKKWIENHFEQIKKIAEQYSNHARLLYIDPFIAGRSVHLKFVYTTGDASGQNMTTTCTWHAVLWVYEHFFKDTGIEPSHYVIEGNGASDKKVSHFSMFHGRGIHVVAECELDERYIEKVLRTSSAEMLHCFNSSMTMSRIDGMIGYNINAVNAVAAIFAATGQDLASIHESGTGILNLEKTERGLYLNLHLPSLVIGTVGGGTHLPKQKEALALCGCQGEGKVERFARVIAGFTLGLEISTFAAIVGGQFAKAHEKLGRNKPVNWITKADINKELISACLKDYSGKSELKSVNFRDEEVCENGIIIGLTNRVNKKLTGFKVLEIEFQNGSSQNKLKEVILLKSKPLDTEVIKGLHLMASAVDPTLSNLIFKYQKELEYWNCHKKEIQMYHLLNKHGQKCTPTLYGALTNESREIYLLLLEFLKYNELRLVNSENEPDKWKNQNILDVIKTIHGVHQLFSERKIRDIPKEITVFEPWKAHELYLKLAEIIIEEYRDNDNEILQINSRKLLQFLDSLESEHRAVGLEKSLVHNDFNTRNIAIRQDGSVCIYDWELAVIDFPHRDIVEFLSFVLPDDFDTDVLKNYLDYHYSLQTDGISRDEWKKGYVYSLKEYLVTRVSFYLTGRIILDFEFAERIFLNAFRMLDAIESW